MLHSSENFSDTNSEVESNSRLAKEGKIYQSLLKTLIKTFLISLFSAELSLSKVNEIAYSTNETEHVINEGRPQSNFIRKFRIFLS